MSGSSRPARRARPARGSLRQAPIAADADVVQQRGRFRRQIENVHGKLRQARVEGVAVLDSYRQPGAGEKLRGERRGGTGETDGIALGIQFLLDTRPQAVQPAEELHRASDFEQYFRGRRDVDEGGIADRVGSDTLQRSAFLDRVSCHNEQICHEGGSGRDRHAGAHATAACSGVAGYDLRVGASGGSDGKRPGLSYAAPGDFQRQRGKT
jgi:hypothetical protein